MLESPNKQYYPLLPFHIVINYLKIKPKHSDDISNKASYLLSKSYEFENQNENCFYNQNNIAFQNNSSYQTTKISSSFKKKSSVKMDEDSKNFKLTFYQIFTSRKKFQKKFVVMIHNEICSNLELRKVNRDEARSINLYFEHFASHKDEILLYIKKNLNSIRHRIPELIEIPK